MKKIEKDRKKHRETVRRTREKHERALQKIKIRDLSYSVPNTSAETEEPLEEDELNIGDGGDCFSYNVPDGHPNSYRHWLWGDDAKNVQERSTTE